ncbi:Hemicentin 1 [Nesidiocoris tenuis]|uniref:Hemicentin 1 n=1 Tax=Nesidiocoris tenuis TaxID=355587 RepID=A0ABN7AGH4_9HEMI|nr:Hemicentin 1 [Nesidiocoris tenuis]
MGHEVVGCCESGPRFLVDPPRELIVWYKDGALANCVASGSPEPKVTWFLSGETTPLQPVPNVRRVLDNGSLYFPPFKPEEFRPDVHLTTYRCIASNSAGKLLSLDMTVKAVMVENYQVEATVAGGPLFVGDTAVLRCKVPQHLEGIITVTAWLIDESYNVYPTTEGEGKYVMPSWNGDLHILNLSLSDTRKKYSCRTLHRLSGKSQHSNSVNIQLAEERLDSAELDVLVAPDSIVSTRQTNDVILPCVANSQDPPTYEWTKDHAPVKLSDRKLLAGGSLLLKSVTADDTGVYVCRINNSIWSKAIHVTLTIPHSLMVHINPQHLLVDSGSSVALRCVTSAPQVSWFKDGLSKSDSNHILRIPYVTKADQGMYQCRAQHNNDQNYATAELRLGASKPQLVYEFLEHTLQPGPPVSLKCIASGSPTPQITWSLDGYPLPINERFIIGQYVSLNGEVISHVNLTKVAVEDGGVYTCKASNKAGSVEHSAPLRVYGPPVIRDMPKITAVAGRSLSIACPVGGYPIHTINWEKDSRPLSGSHRIKIFNNGTLVISNIQAKVDQGLYQCVAASRQGHTARSSVEITVLEPPVLSGVEPVRVGLIGERLGIQCLVIRGQVPITLQWQRSDMPVLKLNLPSISVSSPAEYSSTLLFENLNLLHTGNYTCVATNSAATVSATVQLLVNEPPEITPFSIPILEKGSRLQVACTVHKGHPPLDLVWSRDGINISKDVSLYNIYTSILSIAQVSRSDSGNYTCTANNMAASVHHTAQLIVTVPPEWTIEPRDVNVVVGQSVALHCKANGYPEPVVSWRKAFGKDSNQYGDKLPGTEKGTLTITSATEADEGYYICEAQNGIGAGLSGTAFVSVNALPKFLSGGRKVLARRGTDASLKCEAKGDTPLSIKWQRNHMIIPESSEKYELVETPLDESKTTKSQLIVRNTSQKDTGKYVCIASNAYGSDEMVVHLSMQDVPEVPKDLKSVDVGSRHLKIVWSQPQDNNSPITHYSVSYTGDADSWDNVENTKEPKTWHELTNLTPSKKYLIRVYAVNQVGMSSASMILPVTTASEKPSGPPIDVSASPTSSSEVTIHWKPPIPEHRNAPILGYIISYRRASHDEAFFNVTLKGMPDDIPQPYTISGLKSFTKYQVIIQAYNSVGVGIASAPVTVMTLEGAPNDPPRDVVCRANGPQSLDIQWSKPPKSSQNGNIIGYKISYTKLTGKHNLIEEDVEETKETEKESTVLGELENFTEYSIRISAFTLVGVGPESKPINCSTLEAAPEPPRNLKIAQSTMQHAIVSWLKPRRPNGLLTKVNIHQRELSNSKSVQVISVEPEDWFYRLNIKLGNSYEFWLTAVNSAGESEPSTAVTLVPNKTILPQLYSIGQELCIAMGSHIDLTCEAVGIPSPGCSWQHNRKPIKPNSHYKIWPNRTLSLTNVQYKHNGNHTCTAHNSYGTDSITYIITVVGPPSAPELVLISATVSNVTVGWQRPRSTRGLINYKLIYQMHNISLHWREVTIRSGEHKYTISNLMCGSRVKVKIYAVNKIGPGEISSVLDASTQAPTPEPPLPDQAVSTTKDSIVIHLELWRHRECPLLHFIIERKSSQHNWIFVTERSPGASYEMTGLNPGTLYQIRVIAHTPAGQTVHYFHAKTKNSASETLFIPAVEEDRSSKSAIMDLHVGLPIVASLLALLLTLVTIAICLKHRVWYCTREDASIDTLQQQEFYSATNNKKEPINIASAEYSEEIYPYATFQMPKPYKEKLSQNFQTFVYQSPAIANVNQSHKIRELPYVDHIIPSEDYDSPDDAHFHSLHQQSKSSRPQHLRNGCINENFNVLGKTDSLRKNKYVYSNFSK